MRPSPLFMNALKKIEWLVVVYDKPGTNLRTKYQPEHLLKVPQLFELGRVLSAGPIFKEAEKKTFIGSTFNMIAESREDVMSVLRKDIYAEKGVWDLENVVIHPLSVFKPNATDKR